MEEGATCSPEGACPPGQTCADDGRCYGDSPSFRFRRRIDVHPISLGNVVRDFPMAVVLEGDEGLAAHTRDDGLDLHFTEADGTTELAFEVESFDAAAGDLVAWVRIPLLSFEDTVYLHYGGDPFDRPDPAGVWHERYLAVWHGAPAPEPGALIDSTANRNQGESGEQQAPEPAGGVAGQALSFDGTDDQVLIEEAVPLVVLENGGDFLVTLWVRVTDNLADGGVPIGKGTQSGSTPGFGFQLGDVVWAVRLRGDGAGDTMAASFGESVALVGRWVMLGATITHGTLGAEFFEVTTAVDGVAAGSGYWLCDAQPCDLDFAGSLFLSHPELRFRGLIDEIRVVDRTVSNENQAAQFENLANPDSFYTVGGEETLPF